MSTRKVRITTTRSLGQFMAFVHPLPPKTCRDGDCLFVQPSTAVLLIKWKLRSISLPALLTGRTSACNMIHRFHRKVPPRFNAQCVPQFPTPSLGVIITPVSHINLPCSSHRLCCPSTTALAILFIVLPPKDAPSDCFQRYGRSWQRREVGLVCTPLLFLQNKDYETR